MQLGPPVLFRKTAAPAFASPFISTSSEIGGSALPSLLLGRGRSSPPLVRTSVSAEAATANDAVARSSGGSVLRAARSSSASPPGLDFARVLTAVSRSASGAFTSWTTARCFATSSCASRTSDNTSRTRMRGPLFFRGRSRRFGDHPVETPRDRFRHLRVLILPVLRPRFQNFLLAARAGDAERLEVPLRHVALLARRLLGRPFLVGDAFEGVERLDLVAQRDQEVHRLVGGLVVHRE